MVIHALKTIRVAVMLLVTAAASFMLGTLYTSLHGKPAESRKVDLEPQSIPFFLKDSISDVRYGLISCWNGLCTFVVLILGRMKTALARKPRRGSHYQRPAVERFQVGFVYARLFHSHTVTCKLPINKTFSIHLPNHLGRLPILSTSVVLGSASTTPCSPFMQPPTLPFFLRCWV
jgi:hypothetical protein